MSSPNTTHTSDTGDISMNNTKTSQINERHACIEALEQHAQENMTTASMPAALDCHAPDESDGQASKPAAPAAPQADGITHKDEPIHRTNQRSQDVHDVKSNDVSDSAHNNDPADAKRADDTVCAAVNAPNADDKTPELSSNNVNLSSEASVTSSQETADSTADSVQEPSSSSDEPMDESVLTSSAEPIAANYSDDPASTNDLIEAAQILQNNDPSSTAEFTPIPLTPQQIKAKKDAAKAAKKAAKQPLNWYAISDVGLVREHNEDSYLAHPPLFAVCDGMGGHAAGEVASAIAIDAICRNAPMTADDVALGAAVEAANTAVIEGANSGRGKEGMGCTATCCIIKDERIAIAHVGDSRCYILHNGIMTRMTEDHSLVEDLVKSGSISADEARDHRYRSIITRALGSEPDMYADHLSTTIDRGDRILLCSDGLSSMVSDYMIERTLCQDADAQATCEALLQQALEAGGHDNVTIMVIDVASDVQRKRATRKTLKAVMFWLIGVVVACAVLLAAAALYINQTYYLTTENNRVVVYQGVPGSIMGITLHHLQNETTISTDDLPASIQENLKETISVSSKEEADKLLDEYRKQTDEKKMKDAEKRERAKEAQGGQQ